VRNAATFAAIVLGAIAIGVVVAAIVAAVAFIAGSTVAIAAAVAVVTAGLIAWLNPLDKIQRWFETFQAGGFLDKMEAVARLVAAGTPFGFAAQVAGVDVLGIGDVVSPQDRLADTIEEKRQTSTAELIIKGDTANTELVQTNQVPGIGISVAESGGT